ncbi:ribose 5-phosphate isomerase B [Garciella nitratireducens]|uniref:Ribose 5-phosphate isomerase B n=1 Tax=Garciella nitratireducens DSM 15102 TaxID=1121911 RepID=A0A1T4MJ63_9FIRM|nr:ribose 5-phosphate isomerase B [Garciella nitratireducens]RBP37799.1 ribose 5-phosphate isomerase B [Garciella nitratireducens]SJZ67150.1 ribose 5-phosphate isomerase B [Garciella nitratireducens DSM 15102]
MRIAIGSDHGGYHLKEHIKKYLEDNQFQVKDFGTHSLESVDYPDFAKTVAESVANGEYDRGILVCGTGLGISIAANKVKGIRAVVVSDCYSAKMSRAHNDANILALGGRVVGPDLATEIVKIWLTTPFEGGRHQRRIDKISDIENQYNR